jgi:hypothetical protein
MHGKGTFEYNGTYYEGDFFMNIMQGQGTFEFADGSLYTGEFRSGLPRMLEEERRREERKREERRGEERRGEERRGEERRGEERRGEERRGEERRGEEREDEAGRRLERGF